SNPTNANYFGPDPIGTIGDNDSTPTLIFNNLTISEGQAGSTQAVITVSLSVPSGKVVTMNYSTSDGTAINGNDPNNNSSNDYISQTGTLTFQPGVTSQTINVTINGDTLYELDETFAVNLSGFGNVNAVNTQRTVTIVNDDPKPTVVISDATVTEGDSGVTPIDFILTLQQPSALPVTVTYSTSSGQAQIGSDFQNAGGTVTFAPGETSKTITVNVIGDTAVEGDENFFVNLLNGVNVVIGDNAGLGVITNDDFLPSVQVSDAQVLEGDSGTTQMMFTVTRTGSTALPSTVAYSTSNGTATAGLDFTSASGTITFAAGETTKNVIVSIKGDDIAEFNESFFVNLSNPSNATIADGQGVGTILNDDNAPPAVTLPAGPLSTIEETNLTISGISVADPDAGVATIIVTLTAAHGTIVVRNDAVNGLASSQILNNGTAEVTLVGSIAAINTTLASSNGVVYRGFTDFFGSDSLTVKANDLGNTGNSGVEKTDTKVVVINVANVNDAPSIGFTAEGGGAATPINSTKGNAVAAFGPPNSLTLSDADNLNFNGGRITVTNLGQFIGTKDKISIRNQGTGNGLIGFKKGKITFGGQVIGTATGGTASNPLVITLNNTASIEATTALMKNITFGTAKGHLTALPRTLRMVLTDGSGGTSAAVLTTVNVTN
ncbi:MAG: Serine protease, subtilase family, partial [Planctomycetaceae bacterium]|nr:Serine protease, subtilase family [Planctomycetaceae bacterium]